MQQLASWLTRTTAATERIVHDMMLESSDRDHKAAGAVGTRYCPSIEAKVTGCSVMCFGSRALPLTPHRCSAFPAEHTRYGWNARVSTTTQCATRLNVLLFCSV